MDWRKNKRHRWTQEEDNILKRSYSETPVIIPAQLLNQIPEKICRNRAKTLRIRQYHFHTIFCNQNISDIDMSYIAAFLDGEGSIYLNTKRDIYYISFSNSDYGVIKWLHNIFECGRLEIRKESVHYTKRHYIFRIARMADTIYFLEKVIPFLHIKADHATAAMQFNSAVLNRRKRPI